MPCCVNHQTRCTSEHAAGRNASSLLTHCMCLTSLATSAVCISCLPYPASKPALCLPHMWSPPTHRHRGLTHTHLHMASRLQQISCMQALVSAREGKQQQPAIQGPVMGPEPPPPKPSPAAPQPKLRAASRPMFKPVLRAPSGSHAAGPGSKNKEAAGTADHRDPGGQAPAPELKQRLTSSVLETGDAGHASRIALQEPPVKRTKLDELPKNVDDEPEGQGFALLGGYASSDGET